MTETQKRLVRALLEDALGTDEATRTELAGSFYRQLFAIAPRVRPLFHNQLSRQEEKFTQMLMMLHDSLERLDNLVPVLWQSGRNHRLYGAEDAHYPVVGEALLYALEAKLGAERLTPEVRSAWQEFYNLISLIMKEASKEA